MLSENAVPGPRGVVRSLYFLNENPVTFLCDVSKRYGDIVRFRVMNRRVILFNHPDAIEELVIARKDLLIKDWLTREISVVLRNGLLLSAGALWKKQRKLIQPGFHRERIAKYAETMVTFTERTVATWKAGETRDFHVEMMRLTLDIVAKTLFGVDVGEVGHRIEAALEVLSVRYANYQAIVPIEIPLPFNLRAKKAIRDLDDIALGIIRERRKTGDSGDLISMLIAAGDMDDEQLRDEALTLMLAGHETTAVALGWALYLLAANPEVTKKLHAEIEAVLGDRAATADDVPKLKFAEAVIKESMRLYSPAWAIGREATEPLSVAGVSIEKGTQLWAAQCVVHMDERWFPNPTAFKPERWLEDAAPPKHAYFPFGGGPRVCIGNAFAMMEMILVLVTMTRKFDFARTREVKTAPSVTLRPKGGLQLRLTAR